ncbi:hypothetical protein PG999_008583 [Apiospora kogelbergensis]|uniref:Uncharacterized protein n=1 Tax=Apiospora kogelbergensis TaxID=1337665 RepID=A0AAW0QNP8_9PEZI
MGKRLEQEGSSSVLVWKNRSGAGGFSANRFKRAESSSLNNKWQQTATAGTQAHLSGKVLPADFNEMSQHVKTTRESHQAEPV